MRGNLTVETLQPGIYRIKDIRVYATLIVGEKRALLYDTTYGYEDIASLVSSITKLPLIVVLGHFHIDHSGGVEQFPTVYTHPGCVTLYPRFNSQEKRFHSREYLQTRTSIPISSDRLEPNFQATTFVPLHEGDVFDLGGIHFHAISIPGHTYCDIGLYSPELLIALTGDTLDSVIWLYFDESEPRSIYLKTIQRLLALDVRGYLTSHSKTIKDKEFVEALKSVLETIDPTKAFIAPPDTLPHEYKNANPWRYEATRMVHKKPYSFVVVYRDDKL